MNGARRVVAIVVALIATQPALWACPICFQFEAGPMTNGIVAAVVVLVGVTASVLVGFGSFAMRLAKNEPRNSGTPEPRNP